MFGKFEKDKSAQNSVSQLVFASSLPLEDAIIILSSLADDQHPITLTEISPDKVEFEIDYIPQGNNLATVKGSLQRWNGIETKLEARGAVTRLGSTNFEDTTKGRVSVFVVVGTGVTLLIGNFWLMPIVGIIGLGVYKVASIFKKDTMTIVLFRERDYLFQCLIDAFKSAGEVEAL